MAAASRRAAASFAARSRSRRARCSASSAASGRTRSPSARHTSRAAGAGSSSAAVHVRRAGSKPRKGAIAGSRAAADPDRPSSTTPGRAPRPAGPASTPAARATRRPRPIRQRAKPLHICGQPKVAAGLISDERRSRSRCSARRTDHVDRDAAGVSGPIFVARGLCPELHCSPARTRGRTRSPARDRRVRSQDQPPVERPTQVDHAEAKIMRPLDRERARTSCSAHDRPHAPP
jgi:hypothetical protein